MALSTSRGQKISGLKLSLIWLRPAVLILVLIFLSAALFIAESRARPFFNPPLKIWFFDVGQGDAIFIETPGRRQILIDGGPDSSVLSKLGAVMPPWDKTLDAVIFTHPDADHITGLVPVLERYEVAAVYETGLASSSQIKRALNAAVAAEGATRHIIHAPAAFAIDGLTFQVLSPARSYENQEIKDANAASLVLLLTYGRSTILLTGDATWREEAAFASRAADIDVLKVGHHGSLTSTSLDLLAASSPSVAVISAGANNRYGHPHPAVLERLQQRNIFILRTDEDGDILLISRGGEPRVFSSPLPF